MTNAEKFIIAAAIDAAVEDAIKEVIEEEIQEKKDPLSNLIGKKYIPQDNSYIREIVNGQKKDWGDLRGVPCEIISKPYIITISDIIRKPFPMRMIKVKSLKTGFIYEVMFAEAWICD